MLTEKAFANPENSSPFGIIIFLDWPKPNLNLKKEFYP
jgi:hypothetical protein